MGKSLKYTALAILVILGASCKTQKGTSSGARLTSKDPKVVEQVMKDQAFEFQFFSAKSKTHFASPDLDENFTMNIRMERDKKVWISVQAMLGIEVARVLITEDSLFVLQKFPGTKVERKSIAEISQILGVTVSLRQIQDIFLGNSLGAIDPFLVDMQNDSIVVEKKINDFLLREFIHPDQPRVGRNSLSSLTSASGAEMIYSEYTAQGNKLLPKKVNIFVHSKDLDAICELNYYDISTEPISSFPFSIPQGY